MGLLPLVAADSVTNVVTDVAATQGGDVPGVMPGGRRRIDRVLGPQFLHDLVNLPAAEIRFRRREAMQEETDLSYTRRLLQGRIDLLTTEQARRAGTPIPTETRPREDSPSKARHLAFEPTRVGERQRSEEIILETSGTLNVAQLADAELLRWLETLQTEERTISDLRRRVQEAADTLTQEMTRRIRSGELDPLAALSD